MCTISLCAHWHPIWTMHELKVLWESLHLLVTSLAQGHSLTFPIKFSSLTSTHMHTQLYLPPQNHAYWICQMYWIFFPQEKSWPCLLLFGESHCQELWEIGQDDRGEAKQASWIWLSEPEEYRLTNFSLNFWKLQLPLNSWQRGLFFLSVCFAF